MKSPIAFAFAFLLVAADSAFAASSSSQSASSDSNDSSDARIWEAAAAAAPIPAPVPDAPVDGPRQRGRDDDDDDLARRAIERGEVLPITRVLTLVAQYMPGDILEIQLDARRRQLYYEVKVLTPTGRVRELRLDARTGALVRNED